MNAAADEMPIKALKVDFDGCLGKRMPFPLLPPKPRPYAVECIELAHVFQWPVILCTCREDGNDPSRGTLHEALEWCDQFGIHFDAVNDNCDHLKKVFQNNPRKVHGDIVMDDCNWMGIPYMDVDAMMDKAWLDLFMYLTFLGEHYGKTKGTAEVYALQIGNGDIQKGV